MNRTTHVIAILTAVCLCACASHRQPGAPHAPPPSRQPPPGPAPSTRPGIAERPTSVNVLGDALDRVFRDARFEHAVWAVVVESLATGERLYELNPTKLVMPASNMKIVTLAAAAERLGWGYQFETLLTSSASIDNGILRGDLIVVGSGDPTIGWRWGEPDAVFVGWAAELLDAGIRVIDGRIIGDDNRFEDEGLGAGWAWDYLAEGYAAPSGAIEYNEDTVEVVVRPSPSVGAFARVELTPPESGLVLENRLVTTAPGVEGTISLRRPAGAHVLEIAGTLPADSGEVRRRAAVANPTEFFVRSLKRALIANGIEVRGEAIDIDSLTEATPTGGGEIIPTPRVLLRHLSPPLSDVASVLMKVSQNLYADTLLKALGAQRHVATVEEGRSVVGDVLQEWGIPPESYIMYDGSGLSRYNYVTAEMLVRILARMSADPRHAEPFLLTLPVAGVDGSLRNRLKETITAGRVQAKTGSIANVRSLSGYLTTIGGERLVFSIIANHFRVPQSAIDEATDRAVQTMVEFRRAPH
ncbi:MAG: D-alanyl-D-alanine carboxypeptidase/D-alanyl-D-alanine-endopeptidase [Acidobacteria bacterium]|nr:D-alanyl-D-alanine carboxypeptidase/D-alanyl-D-alanine-endopeptidase [Acidobacteriota bacterium]